MNWRKFFGIKDKPTTKIVSLFVSKNEINLNTGWELLLSGFPIDKDENSLVGSFIDYDKFPAHRKEQIVKYNRLACTWDAIKGYMYGN